MNLWENKRKQFEICSYLIGLIGLWLFQPSIGNNGIAYLLMVLLFVAVIRGLFATGLTDAMGKMIKSRRVKGQYHNARQCRTIIGAFELILGAIFCTILLMFAEPIAIYVMKLPYCTLLIRLAAPLLFLNIIAGIMEGCLKGDALEVPLCIAAVLRQVFILGFGLIFQKILGGYGEKVTALLGKDEFQSMYGCTGLIVGMVIAELLICLFLLFIHLGLGNKNRLTADGLRSKESAFEQLKILFGYMGPKIMIRLLELFPILFGITKILGKYQEADQSALVIGELLGGYWGVILFALIPVYSLLLPIIQKVIHSMKKDEGRYVRTIFQSGFHVAFVYSLYISVFVLVFSEEISNLLLKGNKLCPRLLTAGSFIILILTIYLYFKNILIKLGLSYVVVAGLGVSNVIFVFVYSILATKEFHITVTLNTAVLVAAMICMGIFGFLLYKKMKLGFDILPLLAVPVIAVSVVGLLSLSFETFLSPHLGDMATVFIGFLLNGFIYSGVLLVMRNIKEYELNLFPGGKLLRAFGEMLHVF